MSGARDVEWKDFLPRWDPEESDPTLDMVNRLKAMAKRWEGEGDKE